MRTHRNNEPAGFYWTPPVEIGEAEICDKLRGALVPGGPYRFFTAELFAWPDASPAGFFDVAVSAVAAVGVMWREQYGAEADVLVAAEEAFAGPWAADPGDDAFASVYRSLAEAGQFV